MAKPIPVAAIAQLLKLTERRVQQLVKDNILPRPTKGLYEPVACIHAYIDYLRKQNNGSGEASLTDERTRLVGAQADLTMIELQKARGELIPTKHAMSLWGVVVKAIRSKFLAMPSRLAPIIGTMKSIPQIKDKLDESIYEVLNECSNPNLLELGRLEYSPTSTDLFPSSTQAQSERVGGSEEETFPGVERGTGTMEDEES